MAKNNVTILRAVIYARYSSERQREESIEGQIRECTAYAKKNNMQVLKVYADRALTGKTDRRPEFQLMVKDSAKHSFDIVLVYKLNRFARNRYDSAKYKHQLKKNGAKVQSVMENIADDPSGILLESVIEGMAEYYSAELAENVTRGMTENALEGKWPGGHIPLGYKLSKDKHLVLDDKNVLVVQKIFELFLDGYTRRHIIDILNKENYKTSSGRRFNRSSLDTILRNEMYTGLFKWKNIRIEGGAPIIIDKVKFLSVQEILSCKRIAVPKTSGERYLLTGKLVCGFCGSPMVGLSGTSRNGSKYYYYTCNAKNHNHTCDAPNVRKNDIEDIVFKRTSALLTNKRIIGIIAKQAVAEQEKEREALEIASVKNQITDITQKLKNCVQAVENGLMSRTICDNIPAYEKELSELNIKLAKLNLLSQSMHLTEYQVKYFFYNAMIGNKKTDEYKDKLLASLIRKIVLYKDCIEIQYNYKQELPTLANAAKIGCSYNAGMVGDNGLEPLTSCL